MTIAQAIDQLDRLKPNAYLYEDKVRWLSELDMKIDAQLLGGKFAGYVQDAPSSTPLLIQGAYQDIYLKWLAAQVDFYNGEAGRYEGAMTAFNFTWADLARYLNRVAPRPGARVTKFM